MCQKLQAHLEKKRESRIPYPSPVDFYWIADPSMGSLANGSSPPLTAAGLCTPGRAAGTPPRAPLHAPPHPTIGVILTGAFLCDWKSHLRVNRVTFDVSCVAFPFHSVWMCIPLYTLYTMYTLYTLCTLHERCIRSIQCKRCTTLSTLYTLYTGHEFYAISIHIYITRTLSTFYTMCAMYKRHIEVDFLDGYIGVYYDYCYFVNSVY